MRTVPIGALTAQRRIAATHQWMGAAAGVGHALLDRRPASGRPSIDTGGFAARPRDSGGEARNKARSRARRDADSSQSGAPFGGSDVAATIGPFARDIPLQDASQGCA